MRFLAIAFCLWLALSAGAAPTTWYVKADANGAKNGTVWADAWTNFNQIAGVSPGDTIMVSGGPSGLTYYTNNNLSWSFPQGTAGNYITLKHAREAGHSGLATILFPINMYPYTKIDGGIFENYETNIGLRVLDTWKVTNNCGFYLNCSGYYMDPGGSCVGLQGGSAAVSQIIRWCAFSPPLGHDRDAIHDPGHTLLNGIDVGYCRFTNIVNFCVEANQNSDTNFGTWWIHHSIHDQVSSDCQNNELVSGGSGLDVSNNIINAYPNTFCGEQDLFQLGYHNRIHHNILYSGGNSSAQYDYGPSLSGFVSCYVYDNAWVPQNNDAPIFPTAGGMQFNTLQGDDYSINTNPIVADFRFFYNTCIGDETHGGASTLINFLNLSYNTDHHNTAFCPVTNGVLAFGNLVWGTNHESIGLYPVTAGEGNYGGWFYRSNSQVVADYNIAPSINYAGTNSVYHNFTIPELALWTGYTHNYSNMPSFVNFGSQDYRPMTVAPGAGINLTSFASNMPGLMTDINGVTRPSVGNWTIGAYESGALVFEPDFTGNWVATGRILDLSGNTNDVVSYSPTNWMQQTTGHAGMTNAAQFRIEGTYPGQPGFNMGDYGAVTNWYQIDKITNGTISVWAKFDVGSYAGSEILRDGYKANSSSDSPQGILSSNSWTFGRQQSSEMRFTIYQQNPGTGVETDNVIFFPDDTVGGGDYATTNWALYTVTWSVDNNQLIGYYNGVAFQTNTMANAPYLRAYSPSHWISLGCNHHEGTPQMDFPADLYPNNAWFSGSMEGLFLSNRAWLAGEIHDLYSRPSGGGPLASSFHFNATRMVIRAPMVFR